MESPFTLPRKILTLASLGIALGSTALSMPSWADGRDPAQCLGESGARASAPLAPSPEELQKLQTCFTAYQLDLPIHGRNSKDAEPPRVSARTRPEPRPGKLKSLRELAVQSSANHPPAAPKLAASGR